MTTTPHTIALVGAKGGSGTSTTAAALALHLAARGAHVALVDEAPGHDLAAVLGLGYDIEPGKWDPIAPRVELHAAPAIPLALVAAEFLVIDRGTLDRPARAEMAADVEYLVLRPCYLALRHVTRTKTVRYAGALVIEEPGRALGRQDIASVTGLPVIATVPQKASIARAIDAGVLATRMPEPLTRYAAAIARDLAHRGYPVPVGIEHQEVTA